jgi:hypothetical protein
LADIEQAAVEQAVKDAVRRVIAEHVKGLEGDLYHSGKICRLWPYGMASFAHFRYTYT